MGAPLLAPFPHHSWLGFWEHVPADEPLVVIHRRQVAHCLMYLPVGRIAVQSFHKGHESRHDVTGGGTPDWQADGSVFHRVEMQHFVDYIDAHLRLAPTLSAIALVAALSPSHFAKKFRQSTGLSLQRFINRRRVSASIPLLQANADTLAGISHALGFSSQAHFTHLFSTLSGMTPAKYRKQFRRTVGWQKPASLIDTE